MEEEFKKIVKKQKKKLVEKYNEYSIVEKAAMLHLKQDQKAICEEFGVIKIEELESHQLSASSIGLVIKIIQRELGEFGAYLTMKGLMEFSERRIDEMVEEEVEASLKNFEEKKSKKSPCKEENGQKGINPVMYG